MFFELRQYKTKPCQRDNWVRFMEEVIIPNEVSKGMVIAGSFIDQEDENGYIWMRRFESEEERERLYKAVYENDTWNNEIKPQVPEMLDPEKNVITRIEATPKSVIQ